MPTLRMKPATVLDKLQGIIAQIDSSGHAELTRLTILKPWLKPPERLTAFGLWVASRAALRGPKGMDPAADQLFREAQALFSDPRLKGTLDATAATALHRQLSAFQAQINRLRWGPVRILKDWDLMLVEEDLAIALQHTDCPSRGYKLAADFSQHYDPRYGTDLNGPSRDVLREIMDFIARREALELTGVGEYSGGS
jgi:hypothetical protein